MIDLFNVVIVSDKTNHKIQEMIDTPETTEIQDHLVKMKIMNLDLGNQKMIKFLKRQEAVSILMAPKNFMHL